MPGVTDGDMFASLQIRAYSNRIEIWEIPASEADWISNSSLVASGESPSSEYSLVAVEEAPFSWRVAVALIIDQVESIGRDLRADCTVRGTEGMESELLQMAWMSSYWDLEDNPPRKDAPPEVRYGLKDVVNILLRLDDSSVERVYAELGGFDSIDRRLYQIVELVDEMDTLVPEEVLPPLGSIALQSNSSVVDEFLQIAKTW